MQSAKARWTRNGAIFGFLVAASDLLEWRGQKYVPWTRADEIAGNLGQFAGLMMMAALVGLVLALIFDRPSRRNRTANDG
jgi:hypothetical protein